VTARDAQAVIPALPALYDEPFADSSQIPTYLVSRLARQHVKVCLSGDGADELFGGYHRYHLGNRLWNTAKWIPSPVRKLLAWGLTSLSPSAWNTVLKAFGPMLPAWASQSLAGERLHKLAGAVDIRIPNEFYASLVSHWKYPEELVDGVTEPRTLVTDRSRAQSLADFRQDMMYLDLVTYLPDDILVKLDRASMRFSLECRAPFLDHRVIEFAWSLPSSMKFRAGQGKWLLRQVVYKSVPQKLLERPKMGFGVPLDGWLRGPLREWAEDLLSTQRIRRYGLLRPEPVRARWEEHLSGRRNYQHQLWNVLMLQAWLASVA